MFLPFLSSPSVHTSRHAVHGTYPLGVSRSRWFVNMRVCPRTPGAGPVRRGGSLCDPDDGHCSRRPCHCQPGGTRGVRPHLQAPSGLSSPARSCGSRCAPDHGKLRQGGQGQVQVGTRSASKSRAGPLASGSFAGSPSGRSETRPLWPECRLLLEMLRTLVFPTFEVFCFWKMLFQKEMIPRAELASPVGWGL